MTRRIEVTVHHPDRNVDYTLALRVNSTPSGRFESVEDGELLSGVHWIGKQGFEFAPESDTLARLAGTEVLAKLMEEIEEAAREEIERQLEPSDLEVAS